MTRLLIALALASSVGSGAIREPSEDRASSGAQTDGTPAAVPVFTMGDPATATWGPSFIPTAMTIEGTTVEASMLYVATNASASSWTGTPSTLTITGTNQTAGVETHFRDNSTAVSLAGTGDYRAAGPVNIGTDHFAFRFGYSCNTQASKLRLVDLYTTEGAILFCETTGASTFQFYTPSGTYAVGGCPANPGAFYEMMVYGNRTGQIYVFCNSQAVANATISASSADFIDQQISIGGRSSRASGKVFYVGMWHRASWMTTANQAAHAASLFSEITGTMFSGNPMLVATRASQGYLRKCFPSQDKVKHFLVGQNYPRREIACGNTFETATGASEFAGLLLEPSVTNLALRSQEIDNAAWTKINASTTANAANDPSEAATMEAINGSLTGEHGVSQAITLTAAPYTATFAWRPGGQSFGYIDVSSIANVSAYFDSSDCSVGTVGSAASASSYQAKVGGSNLCISSITYTGTAASHTHRFLCADANGSKSYTGSALDCYVGWAMVSQEDHPTSYVSTAGTTTTRSADAMRIPLSWSTGPVTIVQDVQVPSHNNAGFHYFFDVNDGTTTNRIQSYISGTDAPGTIGAASGTQWNFSGTTDVTDGQGHIVRLTADTNDVDLFVDGLTEGAGDTLATMPAAMTRFDLGIPFGGSPTMLELFFSLDVYEAKIAPGELGTGDDT